LYYGALSEEIGIDVTLTDGEMYEWHCVATQLDHNWLYTQSATPLDRETLFSLFTDDFHYLQAERFGPRVAFETSEHLVRQHRQIGSRGQYAGHYLSLFGRQDAIPNEKLAHPQAVSLKLQDQVEAWLSEVSPNIRLAVHPSPATDTVSINYQFAGETDVSDPFRATNVGFGISYVLPVLIAILSSAPGSLLLVENPEAHLHPKGQSSIGRLLAKAASCGVQVLIETHSDHVLNGIRLAVHDGDIGPDDVRLHFFQRKEENGQMLSDIISPQIDSNGRIDIWPEGFFDEWDKSLMTLLAPAKR
jgi:predicted ATPase